MAKRKHYVVRGHLNGPKGGVRVLGVVTKDAKGRVDLAESMLETWGSGFPARPTMKDLRRSRFFVLKEGGFVPVTMSPSEMRAAVKTNDDTFLLRKVITTAERKGRKTR